MSGGEFKKTLHGELVRFAIEEDGEWIACFQMEIHSRFGWLPFSFTYGYAPRGPVLRNDLYEDSAKVKEIFACIATSLKKDFSHLVFVRFEPPMKEVAALKEYPLIVLPTYYLQPRFNQLITIREPDVMLSTMAADIKHDIRAGERIGVTITITPELSEQERRAYEAMKQDTQTRSQKDIFPLDTYFTNFEKIFRTEHSNSSSPRLLYFIARNKEGEPVAANLNLLYANTLTYLYGASLTGAKSKRAPGYLHWKTIEYARDNGFSYYDLGGVDETLWQGLTYFKRQFGGETLEYMGILDIVLKPMLYNIYNSIKGSEFKNVIKNALGK